MADLPDELIDQADRLAGTGDPAAAPSEADLRRAASSAYYALFHALTSTLVGAIDLDLAAPDHAASRRYYSHRALKKVAGWVASAGPADVVGAAALAATAAQSESLRKVASAFVTLQQTRHEADYDVASPPTSEQVESAIDSADEAVDLLDAARGSRELRALAVLCLMYGR